MLFKVGCYLQEQINSGFLKWLLKIIPYRRSFTLLVGIIAYIAFKNKDNFYLNNLFIYIGFLIIMFLFLLNFKDFDSLLKPFRIFNYYALIFMFLFNVVFFFNLFR